MLVMLIHSVLGLLELTVEQHYLEQHKIVLGADLREIVIGTLFQDSPPSSQQRLLIRFSQCRNGTGPKSDCPSASAF